MIKICCLYFENTDWLEVSPEFKDKSGPMYTPDYIEKLYNGLKENYKGDFEFICYSDNPNVKADRVIPLPRNTEVKRHWHKLQFFDQEFIGEGDIIVLDIDQVIVSDITKMIEYPVKPGELVSYTKWWTTNDKNIPINGGWYKFKSGTLRYVWDKFKARPEYWQLYYYKNKTVDYKYYGEQNYVYDTIVEQGGGISKMPGRWIAKYDKEPEKNLRYNKLYMDKFDEPYMILGDGLNDNIKIVHFANVWNNIHDNNESWVRENWK